MRNGSVAVEVTGNHPWWRKMALLLASSLTVMSGATISPSLPAITEHFAAIPDAPMLTRLMLTITALSIAVTAPFAGVIVDRFGRKTLLIVAAGLYGLLGSAGLYLDSLYAIMAARALFGITVAGVMTVATTLVGDYFVGAARARFMGFQASFIAFGGAVFMAVGGGLADFHWRAPFAVYLLALIMVPLFAAALYEPTRRGEGSPAATAGGGAAEMPGRLVALIYFIVLTNMTIFYMLPVQIPFLLITLGVAAPSSAGLATGFSILVAAAVSMFYGRAKARLSHQSIFAISFSFIAIGFGRVAAADDYGGIILAMLVLGLGFGLNMPNATTWLLSSTPAAVRGRVVGGMTTSLFLGQFLSPLASQPIIERYGFATGFAVAAVCLAILAVAFLAAALWRHRRLKAAYS